MDEIDKVFAGSIPEIYDRYMVPLIFEPYADGSGAAGGVRARPPPFSKPPPAPAW